MNKYYNTSKDRIKKINAKLQETRNEIREYRITSVTVFLIFAIVISMRSTFVVENNRLLFHTALLVAAAFLWGLVYIFTIESNLTNSMTRYKSLSKEFMHEIDTDDVNSDALVAKELEFRLQAQIRRLRLIKFMITFSMVMSLYAVASVLILRYFN